MALNHFVATMFFTGEGVGWSESHSLELEQAFIDHDAAMVQLRDLANRRALLLGRQCYISGLRVSARGVTGDSVPEEVNLRASKLAKDFGLQGGLVPDCTQPDVALLVRFGAFLPGRQKNLYMRGIWDQIEEEGGKYTSNIFFDALIKNYLEPLTDAASPWGWWGRQGERAEFRVMGYSSTPEATVTVNLGEDAFTEQEIGKRHVVRFSGVNVKSPLNGQQVVVPTGPRTIELAKPLGLAAFHTKGRMYRNTNGHISYRRFTIRKIVTRETGAPFFRSAGRQPARPRA